MLAEVALAALLRAAPSGEGPAIELVPPSLVLGRGETARVVVRSAGGAPRLSASAGTLGPVREVGPGVFEAVLMPPSETHPQVAIVAALAPGGVVFAGLPLVGRGVAVARTEPNASITVEIRGRVFGPAVADGRGVAHVPVEVPPGVTFARHRGKPLDLRVPPLRQVHVVVEASALRADREEVLTVHAFAATPEGAPWAGAPLALSVSAGRLGPPREVAPGALAAEWTLPPGPSGPVTVEARLPQGPPARRELARPAGPPAKVAVKLGAARVVAGDPPVAVVVEVADAAGNRAGGDVRIASSFGDVSGPARDANGDVRAELKVPERLEGRVEAVVEAKAGEAGDRRAVALSPAAPARIDVALSRTELTADGRSGSDLSITISDRFGNGVDDPAPEIVTARGKVVPASRVGPGLYRARYAPGWLRDGGEDAVVVRAGRLVAREPVHLRAPPRQVAATLRGGALHAFGGFTAPYLQAAIDAWPVALGGSLGFSLAIARVGSSRREQADAAGTLHAVETSSALWPVELSLVARRPLPGRFAGFAGAGVRAVRVHSTAALDGRRLSDEWGWALGLQTQAGVAYELPAWHARVRLDAILAWQEDPGMRSYRGRLGTVGFTMGVSHDAL